MNPTPITNLLSLNLFMPSRTKSRRNTYFHRVAGVLLLLCVQAHSHTFTHTCTHAHVCESRVTCGHQRTALGVCPPLSLGTCIHHTGGLEASRDSPSPILSQEHWGYRYVLPHAWRFVSSRYSHSSPCGSEARVHHRAISSALDLLFCSKQSLSV